MAKFFGFELTRSKKQETTVESVITPSYMDGSAITTTAVGGYYGYVLDIEGQIKNENDLIRRYRDTASYSDCDAAIDDIINEIIVSDEENNGQVKLNLDEVKLSDSVKKKIIEEFAEVVDLLKFSELGYDIVRTWYIDGRLYYHILIDPKNVSKGIQELRFVDPRKIKKVKNIIKEKNDKGVEIVKATEEYYVYNENGVSETNAQGVKLSKDSVVFVTSGLIDQNTGMALSYLHKAIKPVNQLKMMEDATVIYTITRAPERRIFYIDVGDLPKLKAEQYVADIMAKYRNKITYDASTGEVKDAKQHLCLSMETRVPLLDGRTLTLDEISKEYKDKNLWAYSCDPVSGKFYPGLITWAGVSNPNASVMRITLDNGKSITCTPEHRFPVWGKNLVEAKNLTVGESMIPFYTRTVDISGKGANSKEYHQIFDNEDKLWKYTHREVSKWKDENNIENEFLFNETYTEQPKKTVHHKDINRFNNSPDNLVRMNSKDHISWHRSSGSGSGKIGGRNCYINQKGWHNKNHPNYTEWHVKAGEIGGKVSSELGKSQENRAKGREELKRLLSQPEWNNEFRTKQKLGWTTEKKAVASEHAKNNNLSSKGNEAQKLLWATRDKRLKFAKMYKTEYPQSMIDIFEQAYLSLAPNDEVLSRLNSEAILSEWKELNSEKVGKQKNFEKVINSDLYRLSELFGFSNYTEALDSVHYRNHKIVSIEYLEEKMDTGCLTIDGDEIYHSHHTFALDVGIYTENSMLEDFWMPRREGGRGTEITTLQGAGGLASIENVNYFQQKVYQSMNVPLGRLQPSDGFNLGRSSEISRDELKFSKFIARLRKKLANLFAEILKVQLVSKGILSLEDWEEIKSKIVYDFLKDNYFTELKELEILQQRMSVLQLADPYIGKYFSMETAKKKILRQNDEEIKEEDKQMKKEKEENPEYFPFLFPQEQQPPQVIPQSVDGNQNNQGTEQDGQQ